MDFKTSCLHSEAAILAYLYKNIDTILASIPPVHRGKTLRAMILNISSFLDICPHCANTLFYNSALRATFLKNISEKLRHKGINAPVDPIKLLNLISSIELHREDIGRSTSRDSKPNPKGPDVPLDLDKLPSHSS